MDADALNIVALTTLAGIVGAKLWHELQNPHELAMAWQQILMPGMKHPMDVLLGFLHWFQAGFAWFGGLLAGIATLMWQGRVARFKSALEGTLGERVGTLRMLDLAAPAAAIGYGVGRIGCLTSGDGDYGLNTTSRWGVHMANGVDQYHRALVVPTPPDALVLPTPLYEFLFAVLLLWIIWELGKRSRPIGWLTGVYLILSGIGRFLVEFIRINPRIYWGMSNAQVAALGSVAAGILVWLWATKANRQWAPRRVDDPLT